MSGTRRAAVTSAVWLPTLAVAAGTAIQSSPAASSTCRPLSVWASQPSTVTPSPAAKPRPIPAADIFVHTFSTSSHTLPSYRFITGSASEVSSHRVPASGASGAAAPAA